MVLGVQRQPWLQASSIGGGATELLAKSQRPSIMSITPSPASGTLRVSAVHQGSQEESAVVVGKHHRAAGAAEEVTYTWRAQVSCLRQVGTTISLSGLHSTPRLCSGLRSQVRLAKAGVQAPRGCPSRVGQGLYPS